MEIRPMDFVETRVQGRLVMGRIRRVFKNGSATMQVLCYVIDNGTRRVLADGSQIVKVPINRCERIENPYSIGT